MAKQLQLTIPTPCHEDWDAMTPVEKGKFCGSCQKQVIDFSNMSDREVAEFFKKPSIGSVCGRFVTDQLDRTLDIPKKRMPWIKYFFQFAVPAFLLSIKANVAKAQGNIVVKTSNQKTTKGTPAVIRQNRPLIGDTIVMEEIVVTTKAANTVPVNPIGVGIGCGDNKVFNGLQGRVGGPVISIIKEESNPIAKRDLSKPISLPLNLLQGRAGGVNVIFGRNAIKKAAKQKALLSPKPIAENLITTFNIFPNPVSSGGNITIQCKQAEEGYYSLQLVNQSGQSVHQQEIWIDAEAKLLSVDMPAVTAGNYFLVLLNKKSGKKFTQKIIVL